MREKIGTTWEGIDINQYTSIQREEGATNGINKAIDLSWLLVILIQRNIQVGRFLVARSANSTQQPKAG